MARLRGSLVHAKSMRSEPTGPEAQLWYYLRAYRFHGLKFRRQTVIGPFIADFTCRAAMLVIELDGDSHGERVDQDEVRTAFIEAQGWRVVRFTNAEVMGNIEGVLERLSALVLAPLPGPLP